MKLCFVWDRATRGLSSWSFFEAGGRYALRRLYSSVKDRYVLNDLSIYGREIHVSTAFYAEIRNLLCRIGTLKNETHGIDWWSFKVMIDGACTIEFTYDESTTDVLLLQSIAQKINDAVEGERQE